MASLEEQTKQAFPTLISPIMPPPRAEDASLPQEEGLSLEDIPGLERPLKAGPNDIVVGEDELGNLLYWNPSNNFKYVVKLNPDQRTARQKFEEDVVPKVKDYMSDPTLPSGKQVLDFGKNVVTGAYDSLEGVVSGEGTYGDLIDSAGMVATGGLSSSVPEGALRIFGGKKAVDPGYLRSNVKAPESVGAEGMWRFEIPDNESVVIPSNFESVDAKASNFNVNNIKTTLPDVMIHDELFYQYPFLEKQKIFVDTSLENTDTLGYHDNDTGVMAISPKLLQDPKELRSVLLHEIQHPVQRHEGFVPGTNRYATEIEGPAKNISQERIKKAEQLHSEYKDKLKDFETFDPEEGYFKLEEKVQNFIEGVGIDWAAFLNNNVNIIENPNLWKVQNAVRNLIDDYWKFRSNKVAGDKYAQNFFNNDIRFKIRTLAEVSKKDPIFSKSFKKFFGSKPEEFLDLNPDKDVLGAQKEERFLEDLGVIKVKPKEPPTFDLIDKVTIFDRDKAYRNKSGEVEPRNVQARRDFTLQERFDNPPESTEDVPRSDQWYSKGGLTMDEQMNKLFAEGGVNTGNAKVDPVSGNEVPPGSMPNEVRDDIDAKLSGGEYVVPADVLRYYGVAFFEKLRAKAKAGLEEMNADGRIGGGMPEEEDDFPFSVDELQTEEVGFAEGGMTTPTPAPTGTFNPSDWSLGSSFDSGGGMGQTQVKKYQDKDGNIINVLFIDGKPVVDVNALGYTEYKEETPVATGEEVKAPEAPRESDRDRAPPEPPKERTPVDPAENYYNLSEADLLNPNYKALGNDKIAKGLAMVSPILGAGAGLIRGIKEAENLADARARAIIAKERGFDTSALDAQIKDMEANASGFVKAADFVGLDGKNIVKNMQKDLKTYTPTTPTTVGGGTKVSTGGGSTIKSPTTPTAGSSDRSNAGTSTPSAPSAASAFTGTKLGFGSAPNGKTISTSVTGSGNLGFGSSMSGKSAITAPTKASDYKPAATDISKGSTSSLNKDYGTVGSARGGRAKGGLVEKPKKVVKTKTNRKTKI